MLSVAAAEASGLLEFSALPGPLAELPVGQPTDVDPTHEGHSVDGQDPMAAAGGWRRHQMISCLTLLELDEMNARYASYEDFATVIRHRFVQQPCSYFSLP